MIKVVTGSMTILLTGIILLDTILKQKMKRGRRFQKGGQILFYNKNTVMKKLILLVLPWHLLTWSDFKGTPKTDHTAYSAMSIGFEYTDLGDGHVIFEDAAVEFIPESSYTNTSDPYIL